MLPLFPYHGVWRPVIMCAAMAVTFFFLYRTRHSPNHRRYLKLAFAGYLVVVLYATFLSRSAASDYRYRFQVLASARQAFSLRGNVWALFKGDFSGLNLEDPEALELIVVNLLLFVPMGYLLPQLAPMSISATLLTGAAVSALIEIVQLLTKLGMLEVDDLLFNTLGTGLGLALLCLVRRRAGGNPPRPSHNDKSSGCRIC